MTKTRRGPGSSAGSWAFALGIGSGGALLLPALGDYVALILICGAFVTGYLGIASYEKGQAPRIWNAVCGIVLAAITLFWVAMMWLSH